MSLPATATGVPRRTPPARLLIVVNDAWFLVSHRLAVATAAIDAGFEVHVLARDDAASAQIRAAGCRFHPWAVSPRGTSLRGEARAALELRRTLARVRPAVLHLVTIKAVLYGGLLAPRARAPGVLFAVAGLGAVFSGESSKGSRLRRPLLALYRRALRRPNAVVLFQNADDRERLLALLAPTRPPRTRLIRGSGVDLDRWTPTPEPPGPPVVLMTARLLRDKGVLEYAEAARQVRRTMPDARFLLAGGDVARGNPAALEEHELARLRDDGHVELLGHRDDVDRLVRAAHLVVLPSWREGLPKSLVEAAAAARATVTTDVPGCRDAVEPGRTGLVVPVRDPRALARAVLELLEDPERRRRMGTAGRDLAERAFDVRAVAREHVALYRELLDGANPVPRENRWNGT